MILALLGMIACVDRDEDRYTGDIPPCQVTFEVEKPEALEVRVEADDSTRLAQPGPYEVWNTAPTDECVADPKRTIDGVEERLYIAYPTNTNPTDSGDGTVAAGPFPVVVFIHANNDRVCQIYRSYYSLMEHMASWGFIAVSVDQTRYNCKPGSTENIEVRSASQLRALKMLDELNADPESRFFGRVDTSRLVLAGHSRGGGASYVSADALGADRVAGVIFLQGVDLTSFGLGSAPLPYPTLSFTAGNDVDLNYPYVEPMEDQVSDEYTWVDIRGGIHAYTADDAPIEPDDVPGVSRREQHDITELFSTAFLHRHIGIAGFEADGLADELLFTLESTRASNALSSAGANVRWWLPEANRIVIDEFNRDHVDENDLMGAVNYSGFSKVMETSTYRPDQNTQFGAHAKPESLWLVAEGPATYQTQIPDADLEPGGTLQFRFKGPDEGQRATVRVGANGGALLNAADYIGEAPLSNRFTQVVIPLDELGVSDQLESVEFEVSSGEIFIDDLRVAD